MCGLRNGKFIMRFFLFLFILFLAPNSFAGSSYGGSGNFTDYALNSNGIWAPVSTSATPPPTYYDSSQFPSGGTLLDGSGNIIGTVPTENLLVPSDISGIPGISEQSVAKVGDIAAALAPYLAQLVALSPQARAAVAGGSVLYQLWYAYYTANNGQPLPSSGVSANALYCGSTLYISGSFVSNSSNTGCYAAPKLSPCVSPSGWCTAIGPYSGSGVCAVSNVPVCSDGSDPTSTPNGVSPSPSGSVPAPTPGQLVSMIGQTPADSQTLLANSPSSVTSQIPVTQTLSGPSSFVEPATSSTLTNPDGSTVTTTNTITDNLTYNGNQVQDSQSVKTVTNTCTAAGSCSTTTIDTIPATPSPFIGPPVTLPPSGLGPVPNAVTPFSAISFGSSWLPQSCPAAPTWTVSLPFGFSQSFTLPTYVLCNLASDMRPVVLVGGGVVSLFILAW